MKARAVIEQAKGMLMAAHHCSADQAFALLVRASQDQNRKLRDIAAEVVSRSQAAGTSLVRPRTVHAPWTVRWQPSVRGRRSRGATGDSLRECEGQSCTQVPSEATAASRRESSTGACSIVLR